MNFNIVNNSWITLLVQSTTWRGLRSRAQSLTLTLKTPIFPL